MKKITVLLADDNTEWLNILKEGLRTYPGLDIVAAVDNGESAFSMVNDFSVDVVVSDIIMQNTDGFELASKIVRTVRKPPVIILMSSFCNDITVANAAANGASYFLKKPFSPETLYKKIKFFCTNQIEDISNAPEYHSETYLEAIAGNSIKSLGVPAHIRGYRFLRDSIMWAADDMDILNFINKNIYSRLAVKYDTTPSRADRAIRHAIEISWQCGNADEYFRYFGKPIFAMSKPSNSMFIATVADKIRLNMKMFK